MFPAIRLTVRLLATIVAFFVSAAVPVWASQTYSNNINDSAWQVKRSVFSCELWHDVPYFGQAVFRTRAGEASGFYLRSLTSRFKAGNVDIVEATPLWMTQPQANRLATVGIKQGTRPLWLGSAITEQMLASLADGKHVEFAGAHWHSEPAVAAKLQVSTIGFQGAYEEYLGCLTSLLPRNFDQIKRTSLLFPGGEIDELPYNITIQLDRILKLIKHDEKVRQLYIDGHADSVGDRDENLELSKLRAELVQQYLLRRGIPEDWVTLRWHGERYPVASNGTASGRAKNRRVTLRLERIEEIEVLPLASN